VTSRLRNVQIDVPADGYGGAVDFWAAALGGQPVAIDGGRFTRMEGMAGLLGLHLQRLDDGPARVHLDLEADDVDATVDLMVDRGATLIGQGAGGPVLADPGGNLLCVCATGTGEHLRAPTDDDARLHVLVIDVPSASFQQTGDFWGHVLGIEAERLPAPFDAYIRVENAPAVGGPIRVLVQDIGADAVPRLHLDLHVPDGAARNRHVDRLAGLGGTVVERTYPWTVMTDPVGTVFCVVPDKPDPQ